MGRFPARKHVFARTRYRSGAIRMTPESLGEKCGLAAANGGVIFAEPREPFRDASIAALAFPSHTPLIPSKREMPQVIWHVSAVGSWAIGVHVVGAR
jgi:hypothetical protein